MRAGCLICSAHCGISGAWESACHILGARILQEGREGECPAEGATGTEGQMACGGLCSVAVSVTEVCAWMGWGGWTWCRQLGRKQVVLEPEVFKSSYLDDLETRPRNPTCILHGTGTVKSWQQGQALRAARVKNASSETLTVSPMVAFTKEKEIEK